MTEELFQLNKKINQIKGNLHKRKQKVIQWNIPYKKVLEVRKDRSVYIDKFYGHKNFGKQNQSQNHDQKKKLLQKKLLLSRKKIRQHHNQLKQLDQLMKMKNLIRIQQTKSSEPFYFHKKDFDDEQLAQHRIIKLEHQKCSFPENQSHINFNRTLKDRINPFHSIKAQKFTDFYAQIRNGEEINGSQITKTFGVGLENTPLGRLLKQQEKKEEIKNQKESHKLLSIGKGKLNFARSFNKTVKSEIILSLVKKKRFLEIVFPLTVNYFSYIVFEDRMKKIIQYYGEFWKKQFCLQ